MSFDEIVAALEAMTRLSRYIAEKSARSGDLTEKQIVSCRALLPAWEEGKEFQLNDCVQYENRVYRCVQAHTAVSTWTPDIANSLWSVIDVRHSGSKSDPIPAVANMDFIYGKYYLDPQDGKTYLCEREGSVEGDVITLAYLPHELVGSYFTLVE